MGDERLQEMHHSRSTLIPPNGKSVKWTVSFITKPSDEMHWHISQRRHYGAMLRWYFKCHAVIISLMSRFAWGWWLADYEDYLLKKKKRKTFQREIFFLPSFKDCWQELQDCEPDRFNHSLFILCCFSILQEVAEKLVCGLDLSQWLHCGHKDTFNHDFRHPSKFANFEWLWWVN